MLNYNLSINNGQKLVWSLLRLPFCAIQKSSTFSSYAIGYRTPLYLVAFDHSSYSSFIHLLTILYAIWKDNFLFKILIMGCGIQLFRIIRRKNNSYTTSWKCYFLHFNDTILWRINKNICIFIENQFAHIT